MRYKTIIKICRATTFPTFAVYATAFIIGKEWVTPIPTLVIALSIHTIISLVAIVASHKESKRLSKMTLEEILEEQENER